jgi:hypothetical protein
MDGKRQRHVMLIDCGRILRVTQGVPLGFTSELVLYPFNRWLL